MAKVQLTDAERLILANQYHILSLLTKDESYKQMAQQLRDGHKWLYEEFATEISENLSDEDTALVVDILSIYDILQDSYNYLDDKSGFEEREVKFPGFDGNNEGRLLAFAQALADSDRFRDVLGKKAPNSHTEMVSSYLPMIDEWKRLGQPRQPLSMENMRRILEA